MEGAGADLAHRIARIVDDRAKATLFHTQDEPFDRLALAARDARDLDETADEIEVRWIRAHELTEDRAREQQCDVSTDHASAFRLAASTRSISSAVMTSGGR